MKTGYKYFAFISYSHKDKELAMWLQYEFEHYNLPANLNGRENLRKDFRPIFRDEDELAGGELTPQIREALANSQYLIVICSPNSAKSKYVDSEIREFISLSENNKRKVFPFIIDGKPHDKSKKAECFPKTLREMSEGKLWRYLLPWIKSAQPIELIAGDIKATGKEKAFIKLLAGTLREQNVSFSELWDRYGIERAERERKEREQHNQLLMWQNRIFAEKSKECLEKGDSYLARKLALHALPKKLNGINEKPYVAEAECALRSCDVSNNYIFRHRGYVNCAVFGHHRPIIASGGKDYTVKVWDCNTGRELRSLHTGREIPIKCLTFTPDDRFLIIGFDLSEYKPMLGPANVMVWNIEQSNGSNCGVDYADEVFFLGNEEEFIVKNRDEVSVYSWPSCKKVWETDIYSSSIHDCISYNPSTNIIAVNKKNVIQLLDTKNGSIIQEITNSGWRSFCFSYNGLYMICSKDDSIEFYEFDKCSVSYRKQFSQKIKLLRSFHHKPLIVCVFEDNSVVLYDIETKDIVRKIQEKSENVVYIDIKEDDTSIAISNWNNEIRVVSLINEYSLYKVKEYPKSIIETLDTCVINEGNSIVIFDKTNFESKICIDSLSALTVFQCAPALYYSKRILCPQNNSLTVNALCRFQNGKEVVVIEDINIENSSQHNLYSNFVCLEDSSILYHSSTGQLIYRNKKGESTILSNVGYKCFMVLAPNKEYVVVVMSSKLLIVDTKDFTISKEIKKEGGWINDVAISQDSHYVAFAGTYRTVDLLNVQSGKIIDIIKEDSSVNFVEFTHNDDKLIYATDNNIIKIMVPKFKLNPYDNKTEVKELQKNEKNYNPRSISKQSISKSGKYLLIGQHNGNTGLHIIDITTDEVIATFDYHKKSVESAIFTENDRYIVSISSDGEVIKHEFKSLQELIDQNTKRFANRKFTNSEKTKFHID